MFDDKYDEKEVMELAMQAGCLLLESGAEIFRVEETMERICHHYGIKADRNFVLTNGIFFTAEYDDVNVFARVQRVKVGGSRLDRIEAVNQLSREIESGMYTPDEALKEVDRIKRIPAISPGVQIFASGVGSAAFTFLLGGSLSDCLAAFFVGLVVYVYVLFIFKRYLSKIVGNIGGGLLATVLCIFLYFVEVGDHMNFMIIGSVMPLVPGISFTNGIREIAEENYISGAVRLLDAILAFLCIAVGVGIGISIMGSFVEGVFIL
ncbi:MAG: threonine/serine exporter family protein [Clostridiales bacterium]|nr:threonine/serine exporter family protein [Clostridiales bacterium]